MDEEAPKAQTSRKKRVRRIGSALGAVAAALFCFFAGWFVHLLSLGKNARSLLWAIRTAEREYYTEVDGDALYSDLFDALTDDLDIYSAYYTKEEYEKVLASDEGKGNGYGLTLSGTSVYRVDGGSPAERAGLRAGMRIFSFGADENSLQEGDKDALLAFLRGRKEECALVCGFKEDGSDGKIYSVAPCEYRVSYCEYRDAEHACRFSPSNLSEKTELGDALAGADEETAYIRIDAFYGTAAEEFGRCLAEMKTCGKKKLVLDLRRNGGGYLSVFQKISAYLMKDAEGKNPIVATAVYRDGTENVYRAGGNSYFDYFPADGKIAVLADENTASASECLLGAMVSYHTIGYSDIYLRAESGKTYGKGIMQSNFRDSAGNVLKLTVAHINWPDGTSIHGKGVTTEDGAIPIDAPLLPAAEDSMLSEVLARL